MKHSNLKKLKVVLSLSLAIALVAPISFPNSRLTTEATAATVSISKKKLNLKIGQTKKLEMKGTKEAITWSSSDKEVATVSKTGKVTAKATGVAQITANVNDKTYKCQVTVAPFANKTYTFGKISFAIPKNWKSEENSANGMSAVGFYPSTVETGETLSTVVTYAIPLEETATLEAWEESVTTVVSEEVQLQALQLQLGDSVSIKNFKQETLEGASLTTIYTVFDVQSEGANIFQCYIYDIYLGDTWFEIVGNYAIDSTSPTVSEVSDTIFNTLKIGK